MGDPLDTRLRAIADPTRRAILDLLVERGPQRAGDIAGAFPDLARPGISKHLRVLRAAELIGEIEAEDGRERRYQFRVEALLLVKQWLARYEAYWNERLDALQELVERDAINKKGRDSSRPLTRGLND